MISKASRVIHVDRPDSYHSADWKVRLANFIWAHMWSFWLSIARSSGAWIIVDLAFWAEPRSPNQGPGRLASGPSVQGNLAFFLIACRLIGPRIGTPKCGTILANLRVPSVKCSLLDSRHPPQCNAELNAGSNAIA